MVASSLVSPTAVDDSGVLSPQDQSQSSAARELLYGSGLPRDARLEDFRTSSHNIVFDTANWGKKSITDKANRECSYIVRDFMQRVTETTRGADIAIASATSNAAKDDLRLPTKMTMRFNVIPNGSEAPSNLLWVDQLKRGAVPRDLWMHTADFGVNSLADISVDDEQEVVIAVGTELASILDLPDIPKEWSIHGEGKCGDWEWESQVGPDHTARLGPGGFEWQLCLSQSSDAHDSPQLAADH